MLVCLPDSHVHLADSVYTSTSTYRSKEELLGVVSVLNKLREKRNKGAGIMEGNNGGRSVTNG